MTTDGSPYLSRRPALLSLLLILFLGTLGFIVQLAFGIPWRAAVAVTAVSSVISVYVAYRLVRHPDDPGWFVRLVQRLGGV